MKGRIRLPARLPTLGIGRVTHRPNRPNPHRLPCADSHGSVPGGAGHDSPSVRHIGRERTRERDGFGTRVPAALPRRESYVRGDAGLIFRLVLLSCMWVGVGAGSVRQPQQCPGTSSRCQENLFFRFRHIPHERKSPANHTFLWFPLLVFPSTKTVLSKPQNHKKCQSNRLERSNTAQIRFTLGFHKIPANPPLFLSHVSKSTSVYVVGLPIGHRSLLLNILLDILTPPHAPRDYVSTGIFSPKEKFRPTSEISVPETACPHLRSHRIRTMI
jgi:hypothetical protein